MSTFGDNTPRQALLDSAHAIKAMYGLTWLELLAVVADVLAQLLETTRFWDSQEIKS